MFTAAKIPNHPSSHGERLLGRFDGVHFPVSEYNDSDQQRKVRLDD